MTAAALAAALAALQPGPTNAARAEAVAPAIVEVADRCGLPAPLLAAVAWEESSLRVRARSSAGALGLMGLLRTGAVDEMFGDAQPTDRALLDPVVNLEVGCGYLQHLRHRCHGMRRALWRYNGGKPASWGYARRVLRTWKRLVATSAVAEASAATPTPPSVRPAGGTRTVSRR